MPHLRNIVGSNPTNPIKMEIEDILMRNQQLILENEALRLQIEDLKDGFEGSCMACELVGELNKKLLAERDEARLEVRALQKKIGYTSTMLYDWDGYYNPHSQSGNIVEMAKLVEEAYSALQGRSWNEEKA